MRKKVMECAKKIWDRKLPFNVLHRLDYELEIISRYHLENDILTLSEIMKKWRNLGYFIHGDGCLKESLIMYLLGIIDVNPMGFNQLFELNFKNKQFEIIVPEEIQEKFAENVKDKGVNISIHYKSWPQVNLLSKLERDIGIRTCNLSFDDWEVLQEFVKKEPIGYRYTTVDFLLLSYGFSCPFGIKEEELKTFYDYITTIEIKMVNIP